VVARHVAVDRAENLHRPREQIADEPAELVDVGDAAGAVLRDEVVVDEHVPPATSKSPASNARGSSRT